MEEANREKASKLLGTYPAVKLGYLFGSRATGQAGPTSDFDFAIYLEGLSREEENDLRLKLQTELSRIYSTDRVDLVLLNRPAGPELKYQIIGEGILFYEQGLSRVSVEPRILNEYFDFRDMARRHNLTKV